MPWKRRPFRGGELGRALNIADLREIARRRVPGFAFEYVEGGAEDEATLRENRAALERLKLIPRILIDTSARHQRVAILGRPANAPLVIAPTGLNGMLHPEGDLALARAAARLGVPFTLSTLSTGISVFNSVSGFANAVSSTFNGTNKVYRLVAVGQFNGAANTFVASRISVALHE